MRKYRVFSADHEKSGQQLLDIRNAVNSEDFFPVFERHGLGDINPLGWYSLQQILDVFNEIEKQGGGMFDFVSIGMKIGSDIDLPPGMSDLPFSELIKFSPELYKMFNRGSNIGWIKVEEVNARHLKLLVCVPDPDDLWYGIYYGFARRYLPKGQRFVIHYDEKMPRREQGGEVTILHLKLD